MKFCPDKRVSCLNQLPIAEYEEEEAKGSFYFKVFGKELIYNYFTYDDVRELIEDGVIRVNNDLKDMLKKGKGALLIIKKLAVSRPIISLLFCLSKVFFVEFSTGKNWNLTKVFVPVEVKFYQPSCVGLPVKFSLESVLYLRVNTTVKAEVQPKFFIPLPEQVTVSGKLNIRYDLHDTMSYCTFLLCQILSIPKEQSLCLRIIAFFSAKAR